METESKKQTENTKPIKLTWMDYGFLSISLLMFFCIALYFGYIYEPKQEETPQSPQETVCEIQDSIRALQNSVASLQDSVKNILAKNPDIDVQMRLNHLEDELKITRDDVRHSVNDYNDKMSNYLSKLSILLSIMGVLAALFGFVVPFLERRDLADKIEDINKKLADAQDIKKQINEDKTIVENTAKEAKALQLFNEAVKEENIDKAIDLYNQCIKINPNFAEAYQNLGILKYKKNIPGEALENIEIAIKVNENLPEAYFYHGLLKYGIEGPQSTLVDIQRAIDKNTYYAEPYYIKALLEFEFGNSIDAVKSLEYARKLKYDIIEALSIRDYLAGRMKALDNAIHYCEYSDDMRTLIGLIKTEKSKDSEPIYLCVGLGLNSISIEIPNSVTKIGDGAFAGCTSLTSVKIPDSVTEIGWGAFWGCTRLTSIEIPDNVTKIGYYAFRDCTFFTEFHLKQTSPVDFSSAFEYLYPAYNITLYVPKGSGEAYKKHKFYSQFKEIIEE